MINKTVKVADEISQRDYTDEGQLQRLKFVGRVGIVVDEHNSHGLCYDVEFSTGFATEIATYDPDELEWS